MQHLTIQEVARVYESSALTQCREAEQAGQEPPTLLSVHATAGGYVADFVAPRRAFLEVRKAIIGMGGQYRVAFV